MHPIILVFRDGVKPLHFRRERRGNAADQDLVDIVRLQPGNDLVRNPCADRVVQHWLFQIFIVRLVNTYLGCVWARLIVLLYRLVGNYFARKMVAQPIIVRDAHMVNHGLGQHFKVTGVDSTHT